MSEKHLLIIANKKHVSGAYGSEKKSLFNASTRTLTFQKNSVICFIEGPLNIKLFSFSRY